jgi:cytochrome c peroxidase
MTRPLLLLIAAMSPGLAAAAASADAVELGRLLFFDKRLSSDGSVSCASCHSPDHGFADPRPRSEGVGGRKGARNAPTVLNKDRARRLFWDGRAASLEEQARGPLLHPDEMGNQKPELERRLSAIPEYEAFFLKAFGDKGVTLDRITRAIADYERSLVRRDSPFDRYLAGDHTALTPSQERGRALFFGKAGCTQCHLGPELTSDDFANVGAGREQPPDEGRRAITWRGSDWRLFKIPSLREVARTAPYMHDGSLRTLEEVVDFYDRGGEVVENKDYRVRPLQLSAAEKSDLVAFLHALTSTAGAPQATAGVPSAQCFPVEQLSAEDRAKADALFLRILDGEGLYTVAGGVKPMSSGFLRFALDAANPDPARLNEDRRLLQSFRCGEEVFATVQHFQQSYENPKTGRRERSYEGVVFAREALRRRITALSSFFAPLGLGTESHPMEVLMALEYSPKGPRWRGLGLLYGYPPAAVDFFVDAGLSQEKDGKFVERDFLSFPTFERADRGVVYAVPKGHAETAEDREFRARLGRILAEYRARRERFIGEGKPGAAALLRDWYCGSGGDCRFPEIP